MHKSFRLMAKALVVGLCFAGTSAMAAYPEKPVTIIVPWPAGGSTDILARLLSEHLTQSMGNTFVVENRSGASGNIGSLNVARAKPDGYTLLVGAMSTHTMNQALFPTMPFDGVEDFTPIAELALVTTTMVVNADLPVKTVAELISYAKEKPGVVAYASAGPGSINHLAAALFEKATSTEFMHVPYRGGAPAVLDTAAGRTQLFFSAGTQTLPHVKAGKLKLLAVTEAQRSPLLEGVPTVGETVPGYEFAVWYGAFGPKGMDPALVARLNKEINVVLAKPEVKEKMNAQAVELRQSTPESFSKLVKDDAAKYGKLVRDLGIKAE
ncbi:Bug family tripartite tricarboxylate transporter substrate binding protein [Achromobacter spanius]|uniref:Bug family tripartite tricarboxylate transporter substrate binding protein n=1 Tax=Achromobacter spanius TaxID=217203 RepID=UPI00381CED2A